MGKQVRPTLSKGESLVKKFIFLGILVVVIGLGVTGYLILGGNGDQVKAALNNMRSAKSYHAEVTVGSTTLSGDYDFANNKSKGTVSASGQNVAFVIVGSDDYFSTDGGQNFAHIAGDASTMQTITTPKDAMTRISDSVNGGSLLLANADPPTDTIGSATCKHLTAKNSTGNSDVWVATDGSYVCEIKMSGTAGGTGDYSIKITNFNAPVDINAPAVAGN